MSTVPAPHLTGQAPAPRLSPNRALALALVAWAGGVIALSTAGALRFLEPYGVPVVIVAAAAALVALALPDRRRIVAAHVIGLADFATSMVVGVVLTVTAPQALAGATDVPVAFVLFFVVGFSSVASAAALRGLLRRDDRWALSAPPLR